MASSNSVARTDVMAKVTVTYRDDFHIFPLISGDILRWLPIVDVDWTAPTSNASAKRIPSLDLNFVKCNPDVLHRSRPLFATGASDQLPYLHIFFVNCEDMETYKQSVRGIIREWQQSVLTSASLPEWLIVYVSAQDSQVRGNKFSFRTSSTVLDKIRSDFNTGRKDRCVQIRIGETDADLRQSFLDKIKDGLLWSFNDSVTRYEEDIRVLDQQRLTPRWSFLQFFAIKAELAEAFELFGLFDEALIRYDELEATFMELALKSDNGWLRFFGGLDPEDDSADCLNYKRKGYQSLISQGSISVFDFRVYLFGRQYRLLALMSRATENLHRSVQFISAMTSAIYQNKMNIPVEHFLESWAFSAVMCVLQHDTSEPSASQNDALMSVESAKGKLYSIAKTQLDKLGCANGLLPASITLQSNSRVSHGQEGGALLKFSNAVLLEALGSANNFYKLYQDITRSAISFLQRCGKMRQSYILSNDLALLYKHCSQHEEASQLLLQTSAHFRSEKWPHLHYFTSSQLSQCYKSLGKLSEFTKAGLMGLENLDADESTLKTCFEELMSALPQLAANLSADSQPFFQFRSLTLNTASDQESSFVLKIHSNLPMSVTFDAVRLVLTGGATGKAEFAERSLTIFPAENTINLLCTTYASGTYSASSLSFDVGKLSLGQKLDNVVKQSFRIPTSEKHVVIAASLPNPYLVHKRPKILVTVDVQKEDIVRGLIQIVTQASKFRVSEKNDVEFVVTSAQEKAGKRSTGSIKFDNGSLNFPQLAANDVLSLVVPVDISEKETVAEIKLIVKYFLPDGRERSLITTKRINFGIPFTLNCVTHFFPERKILKAAIKCTSDIALAITGSQFQTSRDIVNHSTSLNLPAKQILLPKQTYNIVASCPLSTGPLPGQEETVEISYRSLHEEIEETFEKLLRLNCDSLTNDQQFSLPLVVNIFKENLFSLVNMASYNVMGIIEWINGFDNDSQKELRQLFKRGFVKEGSYFSDALWHATLATCQKLNQMSHADIHSLQSGSPTTIIIPFRHSPAKILNIISFAPNLDKPTFEVGEFIPCTMRFYQKFLDNMNSDEIARQSYLTSTMAWCELRVNPSTWIVVGNKNISFRSKGADVLTFEFGLIPRRPGPLALPFPEIKMVPNISRKVNSTTIPTTTLSSLALASPTQPDSPATQSPRVSVTASNSSATTDRRRTTGSGTTRQRSQTMGSTKHATTLRKSLPVAVAGLLGDNVESFPGDPTLGEPVGPDGMSVCVWTSKSSIVNILPKRNVVILSLLPTTSPTTSVPFPTTISAKDNANAST